MVKYGRGGPFTLPCRLMNPGRVAKPGYNGYSVPRMPDDVDACVMRWAEKRPPKEPRID